LNIVGSLKLFLGFYLLEHCSYNICSLNIVVIIDVNPNCNYSLSVDHIPFGSWHMMIMCSFLILTLVRV